MTEITEEMIARGVFALAGWENEQESAAEAVTRVFAAMEGARSSELQTIKPDLTLPSYVYVHHPKVGETVVVHVHGRTIRREDYLSNVLHANPQAPHQDPG